jgi:Uma2 family endonuclease
VATVTGALKHQSGPHTVKDWDRLDHNPDGPRIELINGKFAITPMAAYLHQGLADELRLVLHDALRQHGRTDLRARTALGVKIAPSHAYIPDVAIVRQRPDGTTSLKAADLLLAVEVVSPKTRKQDQFDKPLGYAAGGVPYFWRVEPSKGRPPTVLCFELVGGVYVEKSAVHSGKPVLVTAAPVPVLVDVDQLYDDAL